VDLTITKTHSGTFTQGDTGKTYTITVNNIGGTNSFGTITVVDTVPSGLTPTLAAGTGWELHDRFPDRDVHQQHGNQLRRIG